MEPEYVSAFAAAVRCVLRRMAQTHVRQREIAKISERRVEDALSAVIGLRGGLQGAVILSVPREVAARLASRIAGQPLGKEAAQEVRHILAELANTIVGNAVGYLEKVDIRAELTPPTVVEGPQVFFGFVGGFETFLVPFATALGPGALVVSVSQGQQAP